jgi:hypothetical protein
MQMNSQDDYVLPSAIRIEDSGDSSAESCAAPSSRAASSNIPTNHLEIIPSSDSRLFTGSATQPGIMQMNTRDDYVLQFTDEQGHPTNHFPNYRRLFAGPAAQPSIMQIHAQDDFALPNALLKEGSLNTIRDDSTVSGSAGHPTAFHPRAERNPSPCCYHDSSLPVPQPEDSEWLTGGSSSKSPIKSYFPAALQCFVEFNPDSLSIHDNDILSHWTVVLYVIEEELTVN